MKYITKTEAPLEASKEACLEVNSEGITNLFMCCNINIGYHHNIMVVISSIETLASSYILEDSHKLMLLS
jgi:hypothetical protein